jgi:hypothetical protein
MSKAETKQMLLEVRCQIFCRLHASSNFGLHHRFNAAAANGRMLGVLADVCFPMPAAFAFLAVRFAVAFRTRDAGIQYHHQKSG